MTLGEGVIISVGELLLTRKISTRGSYYLLVNTDPGSTYFRGVIIDGYTGMKQNTIKWVRAWVRSQFATFVEK